MAFEQGVAQTVHVTTYSSTDHVTPTAPTGPTVTISTDGGATFGTPTNSAATTAYGISLLLSAAETSRAAVLVRVTGTGVDPVVAAFYFEDNWTATKAGYVDASISSRSSHTAASVWAVAVAGPFATGSVGKWLTDLFAGMTCLPCWLRALARKSIPDTTALAELNATGGTYDAAADSQEALSDAIAAVGGGSGASTVTVTVTDDSSAVLGGLRVTVHNEAEDDPGIVKTTDANGQATFGLDDGDYHVVIASSPAYAPVNPYALTVDGATALTCEVAARVPPVPDDPDYCVVEAWVIGQGGTYPTGTFEVVRVVSPTDTTTGQTVVLEGDASTISAVNGYCALTILRGAVVDLRLVDSAGETLQGRDRLIVPDAESVNWTEMAKQK